MKAHYALQMKLGCIGFYLTHVVTSPRADKEGGVGWLRVMAGYAVVSLLNNPCLFKYFSEKNLAISTLKYNCTVFCQLARISHFLRYVTLPCKADITGDCNVSIRRLNN